MRPPTVSDTTVDPELALLRVLDVAAGMTIQLLLIFHPAFADPEFDRDPAHDLAARIIEDARHLQRALSAYQAELAFLRGPPPPADDLFDGGDHDIPF